MKDWLKIVPEDERKVYEKAGFALPATVGANTALLVIDVTYGFTGREGQTIEEAIAEYSTACGPVSWEAMPRIRQLIGMFRELGRPVIYTRSAPDDTPFTGRATKGTRLNETPPGHNDIPDVIAPRAGEWVLEKTKASAFFQTPLASYLVRQKIDSVIVCGVSTSGCVRASVVDCLSNGFTTFVVDDCCFDRSNFAHCANLFDMNAKYATVLSLNELEGIMLGQQMQNRAP
ncbi:MAG: isochorismatase family protein [Hyphomicrobiales bacterium]|nr:isochorismatase family protein [Hyphomicrobiales bacterium]